MKKKYYYVIFYSEALISALNKNHVRYEVIGDGTIVPKMIRFYVYEGHPIIHIIPDYSEKEPIITNVFSEKELTNADYLTLYPIKPVIDITNVQEAFDFSCKRISFLGDIRYRHLTQKSCLCISPFKGNEKTYFFTESTGRHILFVRKDIQNVLMENDIKGVMFLPVYKNSRNKTLTDSGFLQVLSQNILYSDSIVIEEPERITECPICHKKQIVDAQGYQLKLFSEKILANQDF